MLAWVKLYSFLLMMTSWGCDDRPHAPMWTRMGQSSQGNATYSLLLFEVWFKTAFSVNYWCTSPACRHTPTSTHRFGWSLHVSSLWDHSWHMIRQCGCRNLSSIEITSDSLVNEDQENLVIIKCYSEELVNWKICSVCKYVLAQYCNCLHQEGLEFCVVLIENHHSLYTKWQR